MALIIIALLFNALREVPQMIRESQWRELVVFSVITLWGLGLSGMLMTGYTPSLYRALATLFQRFIK